MAQTYTHYIEDHADEGGDHIAVRGRAFATENGGYRAVSEETRPQPFNQSDYLDFLTGTD
jgi:hypothetical protein